MQSSSVTRPQISFNQLIQGSIAVTVALALLGMFMFSQGQAFVIVWLLFVVMAVVIFVFLLVNIVLQQMMKVRPAYSAAISTLLITVIAIAITR